MLNEAIWLTRNKIPLIPTYDGKKIAVNELAERGYTFQQFRAGGVLQTLEDCRAWFANPNRRRGYGIITGQVIALDFDTEASYFEYRASYPQVKSSWTIRTRRGYHIYYEIAQRVTGRCLVTMPVELKHSGALVATGGAGL